jgi:hypothetical protein
LDAGREGFRLIQAGHEDGEFNGRSRAADACRGFCLKHVVAAQMPYAVLLKSRSALTPPSQPERDVNGKGAALAKAWLCRNDPAYDAARHT